MIVVIALMLSNMTFKIKNVSAADFTVSVSPSSNLSTHVKLPASFGLTIINNYTQSNTYNLLFTSVIPSGWTFGFYADQNGTTPLSDTNGDGTVDTGSIDSNQSKTVYVLITPKSSVANNTVGSFSLHVQGNNSADYIDTTLQVTAINGGTLAIKKEANPTEGKVGDMITWTIHIKNLGSDPIGNVHILDTIGEGISVPSNFSFVPLPSSGNFPSWIYDEILPGSDYTVTLQTTISGCSNADNTVDGWWGVDENNKAQSQHVLQSVKIIPTVPDIQYTPPTILVPYCSSTNVSIPITNNGNGVARNFRLRVNTIPSGYNVSNVGNGWSYDASSGEFTYLGGTIQGTINSQETATLAFTVSMGSCNLPAATLKYFSKYEDSCGNSFKSPSQLGSISVTGKGASFTITKTGPDPVDIGDINKTYTIAVIYNRGNCQNSSAVVDISDTLPDPFIPQAASNGGSINGQNVKWDNVTFQDGIPQTFTVGFDVTNEPCFAGQDYTNTVYLTGPNGEALKDCCGCAIPNTSASFSTYVNDPALAIVNSNKTVDPSSIEVDCSTDESAYTNPSGNSDPHNDRRYTVEFDFNTGDKAPSSWGGIVFRDQLNNNQFTSSSIANISVEVDGSLVSGWTVSSYVPLEINLSGIQGAPNSGAKLRVSFTARATQTNDSNNSSVQNNYVDWSTLEIPGFPRGCASDPKYYEGVRVSDFRTNLSISGNIPQIVEKCGTYNLTIDFIRENSNVDNTDLWVTLNGFTYVPNSTSYSDDGSWCSGTKGEPTLNGNVITWSSGQINEISSSGSITITLKKDCTDSDSITLQSNYLDNCGKAHFALGATSPIIVRSANLYTKITPQNNFAYAHTIDWKMFVSNGGDGTAHSATLTTALGSSLSFNSSGAYIKIENTTYNYGDAAITWPSNGSTGILVWHLNDLTIAPSTQVEIYFKTDVNSCDENYLTVEGYSNWCSCQESNHDMGKVLLPSSYTFTTVEDAEVYLCGNGNITVSVKNPGSTHVYGVIAHIYLPKYLKYSVGSSTYSYNGSSYSVAGDPTTNSITSGDYAGGYELIFNSSNISQFSDFSPQDTVELKFNIEQDTSLLYPSCSFFKSSFKKVEAFVNFAKPCDINNASEASNVFEKDFATYSPNLSISKRVIQVNGENYTYVNNTFPQESGANVTFEIAVSNNGNLQTIKTNLIDIFQPDGVSHKLNYVSGVYQYNSTSGSWANIPWDSTLNGKLIWNNIEENLTHGIKPNETLYIRVTAQIDPQCSGNLSYNYAEVWTGCSDITDFTESNYLGTPIGSPVNNGTINATCPIYQAMYARNTSFEDARNLKYTSNIPDSILVCTTQQNFEIGFTNSSLTNGGVSIYGPIEIYDLIPVGSSYVDGSSTVILPDSSTVSIEPTLSTETVYGVDYTKLTWTISTSNLPKFGPSETIKVDFKLNFGSCSELNDPSYNRQRMKGYDCLGALGSFYYYPSSWPGISSDNWVKVINILKPTIELSKTVDKANASPGDTILYMIRIRNTGDGMSRNFKLTDTLPNGLIVDTSSITNGPPPGWGTAYSWMTHSYDFNTNTITWQSSQSPDFEFPVGGDATVSFRVMVSESANGNVTNTAKFEDSCCYSGGKAITSQITTKITSTPIKVVKSIVEVNGSQTAEPVRLEPGDLVRFRIKIENGGSLSLYNVDAYDSLPNGFIYQTGTSRYAITNGSIPTSWTNASDPNSSPYLTPPTPPTGFSGLQWHILQTVMGTDDDGGSTGANLDTLFLEFVVKVSTSVSASPIGAYALNTADMSSTTDSAGNTPIDRSVIDLTEANASTLAYKPELSIIKNVYSINGDINNTTKVQPGDTVRYKIIVKNTSLFAHAVSVNVSDTLPVGFTYVNGSSSATWSNGGTSTQNPSISGNNLTFNYNAIINPSEVLTVYFNVNVASSTNIGKNTNSASAQGKDKDGGSIAATAPDGTGSATANVNVYKPVLRVTKVSDVSYTSVGSAVGFTVKIENLDSYAESHNINISDTLPVGWSYINGSSYRVINNGATPTNWGNSIADPSPSQTITWNLNVTLYGTDDQGASSGSSNDTLWLKFKAMPTNAALGCGNTNIVSVSYKDKSGTNEPSVTSTANVCVCAPKLEIEKSIDVGTAHINESRIFTLKVSNKNPVDAGNVSVNDYLPQGWVYDVGSGKYATTNGTSPTNWSNSEPSINGYTLVFSLNAIIKGTDDNGSTTGTALDTLFVKFNAHPSDSAMQGVNTNMAAAEGVDASDNPIGTNIAEVQVVVNKPVISISKTTTSPAKVGDLVTYTITTSNTGNEDLINATITDTLPNGVTYQSGGTFNSPNQVVFTGLTIPAGGSVTEQITVTINKNLTNGVTLVNSVIISGYDHYGNSLIAGPATANTLVLVPNLSVTKSASPNPVKAGGVVTYTVTVSNSGNADATNVMITDVVPQHTTFVQGSADSGGIESAGTVTWNLGTISKGNSATVHFSVKIDSPIGDNTIISNISTSNSSEQGPITSNEIQTVVSSVPQLSICKSDSQDPVKRGNQFTYTIRYANNSTMNVTNAIITDTLPSGLTFISSTPTPSSINGQIIVWSIGNITAQSSGNITLTVQVSEDALDGSVLTNQVEATSSETPKATAVQDTTVGTLPALAISKSDNVDPVQAGQNVTYTIRFANNGSQPATNVRIEDDYSNMLNLPLHSNGFANVSLVSHSETGPVTFTFTDDTVSHKWMWTANAPLPGNSFGTIVITVHIPDNVENGTLISDNSAISYSEGNPVNDSEQTTIVSKPVLMLSKEGIPNSNPAVPGAIITYSLNYSNTGNEYATNTQMVDKIPLHTRFILNSVNVEPGIIVQYSNDNGITWTYTPIDSGDGTDLNATNIKFIIGKLEDGGINHTLSFNVRIENPLPNGTVISNAASINCSEGTTNNATKDILVGSSPTLHITKTAPANVQAGDNITYTVEYWNDGTMVATGVVITESYDPNVEFVSAMPSTDGGTNNQWTVGNLNNDGVHRTISITVKVKTPTPNGTRIENTVIIDSDQTEPTKSTAETIVGSAPLLTINKISPQTTAKPGDNIIYTVTVGNTGNANATNVVITDTTPINTTFVSARFISKSGTITSPDVGGIGSTTFDLSSALLPNEEFSVEVIVKTDSPLDNNTTIQNTAHVSCTEDTPGKDSNTVDTTIYSSPKLSVDKEGAPNPVQAGGNITYTITILNSGDMNAHNVIITDTTPLNTTFVSARFVTGTGVISAPNVGATGDTVWTVSKLNAGSSVVIELIVAVNSPLPNGTTIKNACSAKSDEVSPINGSTDISVGSAPILTITKAASANVQAGDNIIYTITVTNNGNEDATNVVITDSVPADTTFVSARFITGTGTISTPQVGGTGIVNWTPTPPTLQKGESIIVELVVKTSDSLSNGTLVTNTAYVDSEQITHLPATAQTTVGGTPILLISKTVYPVSGAPGKLIVYAINYSNIGNAPATNVAITELLPDEVDFYFANPTPQSNVGNVLTWVFSKLDRNESGSVTVIVEVKGNVALGTTLINTATISSSEVSPKQAQASFLVKAPSFWDPMHIYNKKTVSPEGTVTPGAWLTYTNYYRNSGNDDATNVTISDTLDTNLDETTLIIGNGGTYNSVSRTITWVISTVHPGETGQVSFKAMVRSTLYGSTLIANTTSIKSDQTPTPTFTNTVYNYVLKPIPTSPTPLPPLTPPSSINIAVDNPDRICITTESKFVFTFTGGTPPYQYTIDFGEGDKIEGTETGKFIIISHKYTDVGSYTLTVTVKDSTEKMSTFTETVRAENCAVVLSVYHHNFIIGYPDGNFKQDRNVSRAEIATMLTRALGLDTTNMFNYAVSFSDLSSGHWAYNFIANAYKDRLMLGDKKGTFRPDSTATRAEVAAILVRLRGGETEAPEEEVFTDVSSKDWFDGYINTAVKLGLIQGYGDSTFKPNQPISRAEFVTMFDRALYREDTIQSSSYEGLENVEIFPDVSKDFWAYKYILEAAFPHIVTYAARTPINIVIPSKTIPVYLASTKSVITFPKLKSTIQAIIPIDGVIDEKDPVTRSIYVRIINKEKP